MDKKSTNRATQLDLCKIKLEFSIEHNQNYHISIPRSTLQIYSDSYNLSRSTKNPFSFVFHISSKSNKYQISKFMDIYYSCFLSTTFF